MAYTARTLITDAYYTSSVVSTPYQSVSGEQIITGLRLLNEVLAVKSSDVGLIPYFKEYNFLSVVGQEKYSIPYLVSVDTMTYLLDGNVRMPMYEKGRDSYFGPSRYDPLNTILITYHVERSLDGSDIFFYPKPDKAYPIKLYGKFGLTNITSLDTDLLLTYDYFYLGYLKYAVSELICIYNNIEVSDGLAKKLTEYEHMMYDLSPKDLSIKTINALARRCSGGTIWDVAFIGHGYTPYGGT